MKRGLLAAAIAGGLSVAPACGNALGTASRDDNRRRPPEGRLLARLEREQIAGIGPPKSREFNKPG